MFLVFYLSDLSCNKNVTIDGTLDVSGITTLYDLSCNKNVTIDGTLDVSGITTLSHLNCKNLMFLIH